MVDTRRCNEILQVTAVEMTGGASRVAWSLHRAYGKRGLRSWMAVGRRETDDPSVFQIPNEQARRPWTRSLLRIRRKVEPKSADVRGAWLLSQILRLTAEPIRAWDLWQGVEDFRYPASWKVLELPPVTPDIVHCHNLHSNYFDLRALPWLSHAVPVVLTLHDAWLLGGHCAHSFDCEKWKTGCGRCPDLSIYPRIWRDATAYNWRRKKDIYSCSRLYIATPSRWLMDKVQQSMLMQAALQCRVIANGVDLEVFRPGDQLGARRNLGLPLDAQILVFVSQTVRRSQWRDYGLLEETVRRLAREAPEGQPMIVICWGDVGEPRRFGRAEIRFLPFEDKGAEISSYFQAADICLHPAKIDTFPTVILEALACGTPVVATAVGGIPEQVDDGVTGFLVPSGDAEAMAARVHQLLADSELRQKIGVQAVESARSRFSLDQQVDSYLSWYEEILHRQ